MPDAFRLPSVGILAGGAGARFGGADKAWVEWRGRGLVEWTIEAARPQAAQLLVSANRNRERYAGLGVEVLADDPVDGFQGPFAGMVKLLEAAHEPWLMCLPCDALRVPPDLAACFHARAGEAGADVVVLSDAQGIHPTFCYLRTALAADARACFGRGERAPRHWFQRQRMACLQGETPLNLNSPEALAGLP